jgi:sugar lactone lactonase YvrE
MLLVAVAFASWPAAASAASPFSRSVSPCLLGPAAGDVCRSSARPSAASLGARPSAAASLVSADRMIWTRYGAIVDGPADQASLTMPFGLVGAGGGDLYLTDIGDQVIRHYDASRGRLETIAGDGTKGFAGDGGPYRDAQFAGPFALARDARGVLYVSDFDNQRIRVLNTTRHAITVATVRIAPGTIETIAGNGEVTNVPEPPPDGVPALQTSMAWVRGVAVDKDGNVFYCDIDDMMVRVIWNSGPKAGTVETYAGRGYPDDYSDIAYPGDHGDGGPARDLWLASPSAVTVGPDGDLYIGEWGRNLELGTATSVVWRIDHNDRTAHRVAGNGGDPFGGDGGPALDAGLRGNIQSLVFDEHSNLYISDVSAIRRVDATSAIISTYAGRDEESIPAVSAADEGRPAIGATIAFMGAMVWNDGTLAFVDSDPGLVRRVDRDGVLRGLIRARTGIKQPYAAAVDAADRLFVTEWAHGRVRRVDPDGSLTTPVNLTDNNGTDASGLALLARSGAGNGVAFDERGDLFLTDGTHSRVLQVRALPGPGGRLIRLGSPIREVARLAPPFEAISDRIVAHAGKVYVADPVNAEIIEIDVASGARRTLAGGDGSLSDMAGLALDADRGVLYVADPGSLQVLTVDLASGAVTPLADLPFDFFFYNANLALSGDLLFIADDRDYPGSQVHVLDVTADAPEAELYAGVAQQYPPGTGGDGGPARVAALNHPEGIAVDSAGKLLITERGTGRVRVVGTSDILPGAYPNVIRASSGARVDVAVQSNPQFDATRLVASSLTVAGASTDGARVRDTNGDGRRDLVVRVAQSALAAGLDPGAREAAIDGRLRDGRPFHDADWVTLVP